MFHIIIPARYNSSRLPGKLLMDVKGKSLLARVYERAMQCGANSVVIATDDDRIEENARQFGALVCRTSRNHPTGTDRLAEAVSVLGLKDEEIVVNLQGDEPLVPVSSVQHLVTALKENNVFMATLCTPILHEAQLFDPNIVKVVLDKDNFALYFSRAAIPYSRDIKAEEIFDKMAAITDVANRNVENRDVTNRNVANSTEDSLIPALPFYRHIGLYAYRVKSLKQYQTLKPAPIEAIEQLEQLRILWQGEKIHVSLMATPLPPGVDTLAELQAIQEHF